MTATKCNPTAGTAGPEAYTCMYMQYQMASYSCFDTARVEYKHKIVCLEYKMLLSLMLTFSSPLSSAWEHYTQAWIASTILASFASLSTKPSPFCRDTHSIRAYTGSLISIMCGDQYHKPAHQWFVWVATSDIEQLLSVQSTCTMQHVHNIQNVCSC